MHIYIYVNNLIIYLKVLDLCMYASSCEYMVNLYQLSSVSSPIACKLLLILFYICWH